MQNRLAGKVVLYVTGLVFMVSAIHVILPGRLFAAETYDLLFKEGTLDDIARDRTLRYGQQVFLRDNKAYSDGQSGEIALTFRDDDMASLRFAKGEASRPVGSFPATVGNPVIMYFVETVIRDVSRHAGGSPFYIRNRIKASLLQQVPVIDRVLDVNGKKRPAKTLTLKPFLNDKNRSKMRGFEDLSLTITMSADVPGWYHSLIADTKATGNNPPVYSNSLKLMQEDVAK